MRCPLSRVRFRLQKEIQQTKPNQDISHGPAMAHVTRLFFFSFLLTALPVRPSSPGFPGSPGNPYQEQLELG